MQENPIIPLESASEGAITITFPILLQGLSSFFSIDANAIMHPTLFAGWVGLFLTAINLMPIGQLDGGHVARALLKEKNKYAGWIVIGAILVLGLFYTGWLMLAFIILFLIGTQHSPPLNEFSPLDTKRKLLGVIAFVIFILCFAPIPFSA
jgi:membrane-associated protease RseP (regulator of RpoE activity)